MSLQVWRPAAGQVGSTQLFGQTIEAPHEYTLICETPVHAETAELDYHYEIPAAEQCGVQSGDVIGWYHQGQGVVDYTMGRNDPSEVDTIRWHYGDHPGVGRVVDFDGCATCQGRTQDERVYSIRATWTTESRGGAVQVFSTAIQPPYSLLNVFSSLHAVASQQYHSSITAPGPRRRPRR